jgi:hypothetical protein
VVMSESRKCPNCDDPTECLVSTPPVNGISTMHCGCFYEGDATGKRFHFTTEPRDVLKAMLREDRW